MKPLFYLLTAAAHPFGLYVVVPLYMEHCYVVTGSDGAGRAMAAGFACLSEVAQPGVHETLTELTNQLAQGLLDAARDAGIPLVVNNVGGMFGIFFTDAETVTCYQDVVKCDVERFKRFFHLMLEEGVYLAPSAFEAGFMSVAHSEEDIDNTIDAARRVFAKL